MQFIPDLVSFFLTPLAQRAETSLKPGISSAPRHGNQRG